MPTLPAGSYQLASWSYLDAGKERGNGKTFGKEIDAANQVAQAAAFAAVLDAVDDLSLGARIRDTYGDTTRYDVDVPTNGAAREVALKVQFHDTDNGSYWWDTIVPCLNVGLISYNASGKDSVDLTTAEMAALVTALNAFPVVNPQYQTHTVVVAQAAVTRGQK